MKDIPSPFFNELDISDKIAEALEPILKKYGIRQFFVAYSEAEDADGIVDHWSATSNVHSDSMAGYLEMCAGHIRKKLDDPL